MNQYTRHFATLFAILAFGACTLAGNTLTFAQFSEVNGTNDFSFVNNGNGTGTFTATSDVYFTFFSSAIPTTALLMGSLPTGPIQATLTRSGTISSPAICSGVCGSGSSVSQPLLDSMLTIKDGSGDILLESSGSGATLSGMIGGSVLNLQNSSPPNTLDFTSDFINFGSATVTGRSVSFSSVDPGVSIGAGGLLGSFTAAATGTFSASFVPEPGSASLMFAGFLLIGFTALRSRGRSWNPARANTTVREATRSVTIN